MPNFKERLIKFAKETCLTPTDKIDLKLLKVKGVLRWCITGCEEGTEVLPPSVAGDARSSKTSEEALDAAWAWLQHGHDAYSFQMENKKPEA